MKVAEAQFEKKASEMRRKREKLQSDARLLLEEKQKVAGQKKRIANDLARDRMKLKMELQKVTQTRIQIKNKELDLDSQSVDLKNKMRQVGQVRLDLDRDQLAFCQAKASLQMKHISLDNERRVVREERRGGGGSLRGYKLDAQKGKLDNYRDKLENMHQKLRERESRYGGGGGGRSVATFSDRGSSVGSRRSDYRGRK